MSNLQYLPAENFNIPFRADYNGNGEIDNDKEARANTEINTHDIINIQQELKKLAKRIKVNSSFITNSSKDNNATFASTAKIAEELSDGIQRCYFNNINKSVIFKYGNKPLTSCLQIGTNNNFIKNVNELTLINCQPIKLFVQNLTGLTEEQQQQALPSAKLINNVIDNLSTLHNHDDRYALINHTHQLNDITDYTPPDLTPYATITAMNSALASKSDINHIHSDYLTAEMIKSDVELQDLLKGTVGANGLSAFEVWKLQQPPKQENEPDYTINDFITAITGPIGPKGDKGDNGLSAFEVWCVENNYNPANKTYADFVADITGEPGSDGQDGQTPKKSWWEYLLTYGLSGAGAASSIASIISVQSELQALQAQIAILQAQISALVGAETAEGLSDAIADVSNTSLSLGQSASNVFQSIANVFRNLVGNFQVARQGAASALANMRATMAGYTHLV